MAVNKATLSDDELEQQQIDAFHQGAQEGIDNGLEVITAFLVIQTPNGQWSATSDFSQRLSLQRAATVDDFIAGSENVKVGCTAQQNAVATMIMMEQRAQQIAQQQAALAQQKAAQAETDRIALALDPRKLRA